MPAIKTYTRIWKAKRIIYTINDMVLPFPVPLMGAFIFLITFIPLAIVVYGLFGAPLSNPFVFFITVGIPGLFAFYGNKPIWEEKTLVEYLSAQVEFMFEKKALSDLEPDEVPFGQYYAVRQRIWKPTAELTANEKKIAQENNAKEEARIRKKAKRIRNKQENPKSLYGKKKAKR